MHGDRDGAGALRRVEELHYPRLLAAGPEPGLERHRQRGVLAHRHEEPVHLFGILDELRARAVLHDARHRAAGVEVELREAVGRRHPRRRRDFGLLRAEDLARDRPLARHPLHQVEGRRAAVVERGGGNHLGVAEVGPALKGEPAERRVGELGERCEEVLHSALGWSSGVSAGSE